MLCQICKSLSIISAKMSPLTRFTVISSAQTIGKEFTLSNVRLQWKSPSDLLTILMVIGGNIVHRALAQLAGDPPIPYLSISVAPVAFSFGWVAYAFTAVLSVIGDGWLMPPPESAITLINIENGHTRPNRSWVLARLFRDYHHKASREVHEGLAVHFYHISRDEPVTGPNKDWVWWLSLCIIVAQLAISAIPGVCDGNWVILIIIAGGTLLTLATSALPQWRHEKWAARTLSPGHRRVICLTAGNVSQHTLVITSDSGLRLEDLAAGRHEAGWSNPVTLYSSFALALLWLVHLITVQTVQDGAWYLLAAGGLGMVQNIVAAGARRTPRALGFHLEPVSECYDKKVFKALQKAEEVEPHVGARLIPIFFPGGLRPDEEQWVGEKMGAHSFESSSACTAPSVIQGK